MSNNIEVFEYNDPNARFGFTPNSILNLKEMSNKKQGSIDWLLKKIWWEYRLIPNDDIIEEAKAMHKEEIIDAYIECWMNDGGNGFHKVKEAESYYNEQFEGENG